MFEGKKIFEELVINVVTFGIMLALIKWLSNTIWNNLKEALLKLENNDVSISNKVDDVEKELNNKIDKNTLCITGMKKDIEHDEQSIFHLQEDLQRCKDKHGNGV